MKDFTAMKIEVWTDFQTGKNPHRQMMAIRADLPKSEKGLSYIWFVLTRSELFELVHGRTSTAEDGYNKLTVHGDNWFFYKMECIPRAKSGDMAVPYCNATLPRTFMKAVNRLCRKTWGLQGKGYATVLDEKGNTYNLPDRIYIDISQKHRDHMTRLYGQGQGRVEIDFGDWKSEEIEAHWNKCIAEGGQKFTDSVERLLTIAGNSTWGFHQTARLRVSKDDRSFYWAAYRPDGKQIMNGGLINHSKEDDGHDWSIHT